jgi:hypothetical protein
VEALERLAAGVGSEGGHGVAGLAPTLKALSEYRVETLLLDPELQEPGGRCPQCGTLYIEGLRTCGADGAEVVEVEDVTELAVAKALEQSPRSCCPPPTPCSPTPAGSERSPGSDRGRSHRRCKAIDRPRAVSNMACCAPTGTRLDAFCALTGG